MDCRTAQRWGACLDEYRAGLITEVAGKTGTAGVNERDADVTEPVAVRDVVTQKPSTATTKLTAAIARLLT